MEAVFAVHDLVAVPRLVIFMAVVHAAAVATMAPTIDRGGPGA